jgi:hypothetical protein
VKEENRCKYTRVLGIIRHEKPEFTRQNGDYLIYVKYKGIDELRDTVYEILKELEFQANLRNCFTGSEAA